MSTRKGMIQGRDEFISRIAGRLGRTQPLAEAPPHPGRGVPQHYRDVQYSREEKLELFINNWQALTGLVWTVPKEEAGAAIGAALQQVVGANGVSKAVRWADERLTGLGIDTWMEKAGVDLVRWEPLETDSAPADKQADQGGGPADGEEPLPFHADSNWSQRSRLLKMTEQCQLGIVWADYAVANSGTLALLSHGGHGRSVSLLTGILFAVFEADQIVSRMGDAFEQIATRYPGMQQLPSSINLITGPSRSADIENDLTIGIHGPGKVCAFILT